MFSNEIYMWACFQGNIHDSHVGRGNYNRNLKQSRDQLQDLWEAFHSAERRAKRPGGKTAKDWHHAFTLLCISICGIVLLGVGWVICGAAFSALSGLLASYYVDHTQASGRGCGFACGQLIDSEPGSSLYHCLSLWFVDPDFTPEKTEELILIFVPCEMLRIIRNPSSTAWVLVKEVKFRLNVSPLTGVYFLNQTSRWRSKVGWRRHTVQTLISSVCHD